MIDSKSILTRMVIGSIYGGLLGGGIALITGNNVSISVCILTGTIYFASYGCGILAGILTGYMPLSLSLWLFSIWAVSLIVSLLVTLSKISFYWGFVWALVEFLSEALALVLRQIAKRENTTPELLINQHIIWLLDLPALLDFFYHRRLAKRKRTKLQNKQRASDVCLIVNLTQEIEEVFPEEWNEWQHWISDMMELRTRMLAKGMNHRLVSLITFYRLFRFALHIGIDKVFILATRRATR